MKINKSLCIILAVIMLFGALSLPCAADYVTGVSYTLHENEFSLPAEGGRVHHMAENIRLYFATSIEGEAKLYYYAFEKEVMLPTVCSIKDNILTVSVTYGLHEGKKHKIVYKTSQGDGEIVFETTSSREDILFFGDNFEQDNTKIIKNLQAPNAICRKDTENGGVLYFHQTKEQNVNSYIDVVSETAEREEKIVIDVLVNPIKLTEKAYISLFDVKSSSGAWKQGASYYSDGSLKFGNSSGKEEIICNIPVGTPFRYTAIYDIPGGNTKIYIDGIYKKTVSSKSVFGRNYRIDIDCRGGGEAEFYVDDLYIYGGDEILNCDVFETNERRSVMGFEKKAKKAIGTAWVFGCGQYYYKDGEKQKYANDTYIPKLYDEKIYVSESFANDISGLDASSLAKTNINGTNLIDAQKIGEALGMEYLFDARGFFILSEGEFPYKNSHNFTTLFEESDYIYRYVNFANPESEEILQDIKNNIGEKVHPRLLYTGSDIEYIKEKAKSDTLWTNIVNNAISSGNGYLSREIPYGSDISDDKKQNAASAFQSAMESLSAAYLLTGNSAYAEKGMEYMDVYAAWESMGYTTSNLTTGHWSMGMAVGYDSFYNYMMSNEQGRVKAAYYRERIKYLPFRDTIDAYLQREGREISGGVRRNVHWITIRDNFQGVISGGVIALALAMAGEEDMYDDLMHILENVIRSMEIAISLYAPDGGYFEGVGYSEYMLGNLTKGITALFNSCGTDYGFGEGRGFADAGEFFVHMQTPENRLNFSDCSRPASNTMIPAFFALRYGRVYYAKMMVNENRNFRTVSYDLLGNLNYSKAIEKWGDTDISAPPLDKYYIAAESGVFRNAFNIAEPTFAGFHGGTTNRAHDMLDSGEFMFEAGGVPWAIDLGGDNYDLPSYFGADGYKIYRKHTQGENCVLINPLTEPDTYFGQSLGKEAVLEKFVSKPKGAFATVNLTDVYERDVNSYKRGYYFGDNRNTLLVQDEITLSKTSELYWFMHTPADIEIADNESAYLTYGDKKLLVKVYSDKPYTLSSMDAKPLEGTPVISGQNENEGIKKLSLHFENTEGTVNILVKLIYQSIYYEAEEAIFTPMDTWQVPDGECYVMPSISDVYVNPDRMLSAYVQMPYGVKEAYLQIDGENLKKLTAVPGGVHRVWDVPAYTVLPGRHEARLYVVYENGNEEYSKGEMFTLRNYESRTFYENNLAKNPVASSLPYGWNLNKTGVTVQNEDHVKINGNSSFYGLLEFRAGDKSNALNDDLIVMECDINFSSEDIAFNIECKNGSGQWFMHQNMLFSNGFMYSGEEYSAKQWYKIRLEIDTVTKVCSFYVDDKAVIKKMYIEEATGTHVFKLQFTGKCADDSVSYKNFKVYSKILKEEILTLSEDGDNIKAAVYIPDTGEVENKNLSLAVCEYSKDGLLNISFFDVALSEEMFFLEEQFTPSEKTYAYKAFLLNKENLHMPAEKIAFYKK